MRSVFFDHARSARIGLPEAVYCLGKPEPVLQELMVRFARGQSPILFTRLAPELFYRQPQNVQDGLDYHEISQTAFGDCLPSREHGSVAIVSAGTADAFCTWEAARTLSYLGIRHEVFEDVGVAGIWRLADRLPQINTHDVIIVVAGLDAALASVLGGLTSRPIFAVPSSVGYGVAAQGHTALNSMLASCAPGVAVMNIDNGYGAACAAARVVNLLCM